MGCFLQQAERLFSSTKAYLSDCALYVRLIAIDFAPGKAPAGMGLEASNQQALLHGCIQQDGTHAGHSELVGYKTLQDVGQQMAVLLQACALLEDESCELPEGQGLQVGMLLPPMVLQVKPAASAAEPVCGVCDLERPFQCMNIDYQHQLAPWADVELKGPVIIDS